MSTENLFARELNLKFHDNKTMFFMLKVSIILLTEPCFDRYYVFLDRLDR